MFICSSMSSKRGTVKTGDTSPKIKPSKYISLLKLIYWGNSDPLNDHSTTEPFLITTRFICKWGRQYSCAIVPIGNELLVFADIKPEISAETQTSPDALTEYNSMIKHILDTRCEIQILSRTGIITIGTFPREDRDTLYAHIHDNSVYVATAKVTEQSRLQSEYEFSTTVFKR